MSFRVSEFGRAFSLSFSLSRSPIRLHFHPHCVSSLKQVGGPVHGSSPPYRPNPRPLHLPIPTVYLWARFTLCIPLSLFLSFPVYSTAQLDSTWYTATVQSQLYFSYWTVDFKCPTFPMFGPIGGAPEIGFFTAPSLTDLDTTNENCHY